MKKTSRKKIVGDTNMHRKFVNNLNMLSCMYGRKISFYDESWTSHAGKKIPKLAPIGHMDIGCLDDMMAAMA